MRTALAIIVMLVACNVATAQKVTSSTTIHTNANGQQSTTTTIYNRAVAPSFGPATHSAPLALPTYAIGGPVLEVSGMSLSYVARIDGKTFQTFPVWNEQTRHRLTMHAIQTRQTVVVKQGTRIVSVIEP